MANPLFNLLNNGMMNNMGSNGFGNNGFGGFGNITNLISQFNNFKQNFQGDPKQQVQNMLNSGQMSQSQFNQLAQLANQFQNLLGRN